MGDLEGNFTPVLYIGRKVPKGELMQNFSLAISQEQTTWDIDMQIEVILKLILQSM
jgi:hypothetical protein